MTRFYRKMESGFLRYEGKDWSKYLVTAKEKPSCAHYAAVVLVNHYDQDYDCTETTTQYYWFNTKEDLQDWMIHALDKKFDYFFFYVPKMGSMKIKIDIETDF